MDILRTPDDRFDGLPDFGWEPRYAEVPRTPEQPDGQTLRIAYLDEGPPDAPPVLLLHGEPSWSFLYRHMVPVLLDAGLRVVAPDLVGFGRSDKPAAMADHTYARHVAWVRGVVVDALDLRDVTLVCQDWGGLIGLRMLAEDPDRYARVVAANTGLPDGRHRMPEVWWRFHDFVQRTEDLPVGFLVQGGTTTELPDDVVAAYEAPFPAPEYKAGPRVMPGLIPQTEDDPAFDAQQAAWEVLRAWEKPFVCAFSDSDPITERSKPVFLKHVPGTRGREHPVIEGGGHFLQEDRGPELAQVVVDVVRAE